MTLKELLNFPEDTKTDLVCEIKDDNVKFTINGLSTSWMDLNDSFIKRISFDNLNRFLLDEHLAKEIEIKNRLDEGISHLNREKYQNAVRCFDEVIYYDSCHGEALISKSYALMGQGHFVKSLRHYKKAVKCDDSLKDVEYHKMLIKESNNERDHFLKIKHNIYSGDEHFSKGEYEKAVESYDKALEDPSKFRDKILPKLLNKKATALIKLERYDDALACFRKSSSVGKTDYAYFGQGLCEYELGFEVCFEFRKPLEVNKSRSLRQALILNELGLCSESLAICNLLLENHFKADDFYHKLLMAKIHAMRELDLDFREVEEMVGGIF